MEEGAFLYSVDGKRIHAKLSTVDLDARFRGHDEKNTPTAQVSRFPLMEYNR
jgi:hypothetical protein